MSWCLNDGPSFNLTRAGSSYQQLTGFTQRFMLEQNDPRMTPGKRQPHLPKETMKGTFKLKKAKSSKMSCSHNRDLIMPNAKKQDDPIYGGFGKSKPNKASTKVSRKKMPKLKKHRVKTDRARAKIV